MFRGNSNSLRSRASDDLSSDFGLKTSFSAPAGFIPPYQKKIPDLRLNNDICEQVAGISNKQYEAMKRPRTENANDGMLPRTVSSANLNTVTLAESIQGGEYDDDSFLMRIKREAFSRFSKNLLADARLNASEQFGK